MTEDLADITESFINRLQSITQRLQELIPPAGQLNPFTGWKTGTYETGRLDKIDKDPQIAVRLLHVVRSSHLANDVLPTDKGASQAVVDLRYVIIFFADQAAATSAMGAIVLDLDADPDLRSSLNREKKSPPPYLGRIVPVAADADRLAELWNRLFGKEFRPCLLYDVTGVVLGREAAMAEPPVTRIRADVEPEVRLSPSRINVSTAIATKEDGLGGHVLITVAATPPLAWKQPATIAISKDGETKFTFEVDYGRIDITRNVGESICKQKTGKALSYRDGNLVFCGDGLVPGGRYRLVLELGDGRKTNECPLHMPPAIIRTRITGDNLVLATVPPLTANKDVKVTFTIDGGMAKENQAIWESKMADEDGKLTIRIDRRMRGKECQVELEDDRKYEICRVAIPEAKKT